MKTIDISSPKHPNIFAMVDDEDFEWLSKWKWFNDGSGYAVRKQLVDGKKCTIYMHKEILKAPPGMEGDHRFGDKLDNRRENLRVCTHAENMRNRKPNKGRALPKGVRWHVGARKFMAGIHVNNRHVHLGLFLTEPQAKAAYDAAAIKYYGEFARANPTPLEMV